MDADALDPLHSASPADSDRSGESGRGNPELYARGKMNEGLRSVSLENTVALAPALVIDYREQGAAAVLSAQNSTGNVTRMMGDFTAAPRYG